MHSHMKICYSLQMSSNQISFKLPHDIQESLIQDSTLLMFNDFPIVPFGFHKHCQFPIWIVWQDRITLFLPSGFSIPCIVCIWQVHNRIENCDQISKWINRPGHAKAKVHCLIHDLDFKIYFQTWKNQMIRLMEHGQLLSGHTKE